MVRRYAGTAFYTRGDAMIDMVIAEDQAMLRDSLACAIDMQDDMHVVAAHVVRDDGAVDEYRAAGDHGVLEAHE